MTPITYYQQKITAGEIIADDEQLRVLQKMEQLQKAILAEERKRKNLLKIFRKPHLVKGLYLWGGVGIGKTFLMDCFFKTLPSKRKLREHFHVFMRRIHDALVQHQGEKDPLKIIAKELAQKYAVICFDEFFVSDITDAMLLGRLFKALFANGVCLVATSNVAPDDLYKNGLQRLNFLPAIKLIKESTTVIHLPTNIDYRLRHLKEAGVFYTPLNEEAQQNIKQSFSALTKGQEVLTSPILINDRIIKVISVSDDTVWFDFAEICSVPRSQLDYLEIAKKFKNVFISNIPAIQEKEKDRIALFITLIDVLYDARIRLVASASEPVDQLYQRGHMIMEYARTHSRLLEMQSEDYFASDEGQL